MTNQTDFFSQPITRYVGEHTADLQGAELVAFISQLYNYVDEESLDKLQKSNFFYWLTYALYCAVKSLDTEVIKLISALTIKILNQDSRALEVMFQQSYSSGAFEGQSLFYAWMNNYYSLVFSTKKDPDSLLALNSLFKKLLDTEEFEFCSMLVKENEGKGIEEGKNPLLALLRALLQSVTLINNRVETSRIATLFQQCIQKEPEIMAEALTKEFTRSLFKGKSNLYVVFSALLQAGAHDSDLVTIIQTELLQVFDTNPQTFLRDLYKVIALGPYKGLSSLHLILLTLVEAAYIDDNSAALTQLMTIISRLDSYHAKEAAGMSDLVLLEPITTGAYNGLNGMMFLTRALKAGSEHNLDIEPIAKKIEQLIKTSPVAKLMVALSQNNPESSVPEYAISSLEQLVKQVEFNESTEIPSYLINIFSSIPAALITQLNTTFSPGFSNKLNQIYQRISKDDLARQAQEMAQNDNLNRTASDRGDLPPFFSEKNLKRNDDKELKELSLSVPKRRL